MSFCTKAYKQSDTKAKSTERQRCRGTETSFHGIKEGNDLQRIEKKSEVTIKKKLIWQKSVVFAIYNNLQLCDWTVQQPFISNPFWVWENQKELEIKDGVDFKTGLKIRNMDQRRGDAYYENILKLECLKPRMSLYNIKALWEYS